MKRSRRDDGAGLLDMMATGLGTDDLAALTELRAVRATDPEAAPGLPEHPIVHAGDVWMLGDHRLACGDSTDPATVRNLLKSDRPHLMVTDPPYGVEYSPDWRNHAFRANGSPSDGRAVGVVQHDTNADWSAAWRLFTGDVAYVWHAGKFASIVHRSLESVGLIIRSQIIWNKSRFVIGRGDYHFKHEPCWYSVRKGAKGHWSGDRSQTTVWDIVHSVSESGHGTQKPIECMLRPIKNNSEPGDFIYEPFSGSGTTIIAAELTRRRCLAIELNPLYVYVAISRWQNFIGRTATLRDTGETFAEVLRRRTDAPDSDRVRVAPLPEEATTDDGPPPIDGDAAVLTEAILDRWCPPGGTVLDAALDRTRRVVSERLRRAYRTDPCDADLLISWADPMPDVVPLAAALRADRYAVAVVDGMGASCSVIAAFRSAGMRLVDDAVHFTDARPRDGRLVRAHLNLLVFAKGDPPASWEDE